MTVLTTTEQMNPLLFYLTFLRNSILSKASTGDKLYDVTMCKMPNSIDVNHGAITWPTMENIFTCKHFFTPC